MRPKKEKGEEKAIVVLHQKEKERSPCQRKEKGKRAVMSCLWGGKGKKKREEAEISSFVHAGNGH